MNELIKYNEGEVEISISIKEDTKTYTSLIKLLSMFLYTSLNNAHHCICLQVQSVGFFYLENK